VDALLARANLLRMRGQWADAVECCTEALRLDPHSAAAHSLLGDIYENQGRLDKASHWYQLALEQHPDSIADQAKLARVKELQAVRRRTGDPRFSWAYLVAVAGVAFLFVAFVMAALVARDRGRALSPVLGERDMPQFGTSAPARTQPLHHTTEEEKLVLHLQEELHSPYMRVEGAMLNPQEPEALITVRRNERPILPDPNGGSPRDHLLREAYRIGYLTRLHQLERQHELRFVTVRALASLSSGSGEGPAEEVWRGRMDVGRVIVADDLVSVREVRGVFVGRPYENPTVGF
jgi:tetratricopeptide (TPR) repeat protein